LYNDLVHCPFFIEKCSSLDWILCLGHSIEELSDCIPLLVEAI
jgi:hypothetical protein